MKRSPLPQRQTGIRRAVPLKPRSLRAVTWFPVVVDGGLATPGPRPAPIRPVSKKRARENRERAAMADRLYPDRREGTVMCAVPWCPRLADDLHEPLTRARGGSITDEDNAEPVCRQHNDELTLEPEWGYRLGFLKHSWDGNGGNDAA
jgi:hypothetical protein